MQNTQSAAEQLQGLTYVIGWIKVCILVLALQSHDGLFVVCSIPLRMGRGWLTGQLETQVYIYLHIASSPLLSTHSIISSNPNAFLYWQ